MTNEISAVGPERSFLASKPPESTSRPATFDVVSKELREGRASRAKGVVCSLAEGAKSVGRVSVMFGLPVLSLTILLPIYLPVAVLSGIGLIVISKMEDKVNKELKELKEKRDDLAWKKSTFDTQDAYRSLEVQKKADRLETARKILISGIGLPFFPLIEEILYATV